MRFATDFLVLIAAAFAQQQPDPDQLLKTAIEEQQHGDYPAAIRDYRKVIEVRPDMVETKVNLGAALAHKGQFDEAIAMYQAALPSLSFKNPVLLNLGLAYYKKGDFASAQDQFETLRTLESGNVRVAILLGDSDVHLGKPEAAVALLEPMDAANAGNPDFQYVYGSALIGAGRRREGVVRIQAVAEPRNSASGDYAAAALELEALVKEDPTWLDPHVELATLYYKVHRPADGAREREVVERLTAEQQTKGPAKP